MATPFDARPLASKGNATWVQAYIDAGLNITGGVANKAMRGAQGLGTELSKKRLRVYQHDLPWEFNELYEEKRGGAGERSPSNGPAQCCASPVVKCTAVASFGLYAAVD